MKTVEYLKSIIDLNKSNVKGIINPWINAVASLEGMSRAEILEVLNFALERDVNQLVFDLKYYSDVGCKDTAKFYLESKSPQGFKIYLGFMFQGEIDECTKIALDFLKTKNIF